jgi:hypothetical protein
MHRYDTYCGLYCGACLIMRAQEDGTVDQLAARFNCKPESLVCHGCKSDVVYTYCQACKMKQCCQEKGYETCNDCPEIPCERLREFRTEKPHRAVILKNLDRIREIGLEAFVSEQTQRWSCTACGTRFHWYAPICSNCGAEVFNADKEAAALAD